MSELSVNVSGSKGKSTEWDFSHLPCRHEVPPSKCGGILFMGAAAFFTLILIRFILDGEFKDGRLLLLVAVVIGIGIFLSGLYVFSARTVTEFDGRTFRYRHKSLFGSTSWDEPLSKYEGVLSRSEYHPGNKNSSSYTLYIIELLHPDEQRRIKLRESRNSSEGHRASWERYCRQLGLPALKQDGDEDSKEYMRRDPEDLDKSVRELAAEGKLEVTFDPAAPVPDGLELNTQGDQMEVAIRKSAISLWSILIILGITALFIRSGGIFAIVAVIAAGGIIWTFITTPLLRINRQGLHILRRIPWGETRGSRIRADAIESVRVGRADAGQSSPSVVIETDNGNHAIGKGLDEDALEWLKNCILSKVAAE